MDGIYGWMRGLAFFFLFMTAVLNCLPEEKYRRYVRLFLGLLLLILMIRPLLELFRLDEILSRGVSRGMLEAEAAGLEQEIRVEGVQEGLLLEGYQAEIREQIRTFLEERKLVPLRIEAELDPEELLVTDMEITVGFQPETFLYQSEAEERESALREELEEIRTELSEVYGTDPSHIDVTVQKKGSAYRDE